MLASMQFERALIVEDLDEPRRWLAELLPQALPAVKQVDLADHSKNVILLMLQNTPHTTPTRKRGFPRPFSPQQARLASEGCVKNHPSTIWPQPFSSFLCRPFPGLFCQLAKE